MKNKSTSQIFLVASIPTPNGRLHLGHIAGPFLKLDIIKRFSHQLGNQVFFYSGTDPHDSYVLLKAASAKKPAKDICNEYYEKILDDLKKCSIETDFFLNPFSEKYSKKYHNITRNLTLQLIKSGKAYERTEPYPYNKKIGYLPASFISGDCPTCNLKMRGFICENCGLTYKPMEIKNKNYSLAKNVQEKQTKNLFAEIQTEKILKQSKLLNKKTFNVVKNYLKITKEIRLTSPINWGVELTSNTVCYNYGTFFPYCVLLGEICKKQHKLSTNPFLDQSQFINVSSFGVDNIATYAVNTFNHAISLPTYKGFDIYLSNHFLTLNGDKFSTSRNHAVWVNKIPNIVSMDIVRIYLLEKNCDSGANDFKVSEFIDFYNKLAILINNAIISKMHLLKNLPEQISTNTYKKFQAVLEKRKNFALPHNYNAKKISSDIQKCLHDINSNNPINHFYWKLKTLVIQIYPVMPKLAIQLWDKLGEEGHPSIEQGKIYTKPKANKFIPYFERITPSHLPIG